jgi:tetratricopeptide (TPR) repeat protein
MTSHLLKAMGFWIWGLIAIALSVTLISVNGRVLSIFRAHHLSVASNAISSTDSGPSVDRHSPSGVQAQAAYENALATGAAPAEDRTSMTRTLFGIAATTNQYQATINYGTEMADAGTATPNDLAIISQSYFQLKDCKNSAAWSDKAVSASRKAGEAPKENLFLFKLQCASDSGDIAAMIPILIDLIRLNNKSTYWNTLLRIERQEEREDHNTLMLYRIMYNTSAMTAGSDYIEMAQLLGDAALPAEAQTVLEKAMSAGLIKEEQKERTTRLLDSFKARADADKKGRAQLDAEAIDNPAGELDVKLGEIYYGFGDYPNAIAAITRGIAKGQIKHQDEAYVYLGLSQATMREGTAAKEVLTHLNTVPGVSQRVATLWQLYAETRR